MCLYTRVPVRCPPWQDNHGLRCVCTFLIRNGQTAPGKICVIAQTLTSSTDLKVTNEPCSVDCDDNPAGMLNYPVQNVLRLASIVG